MKYRIHTGDAGEVAVGLEPESFDAMLSDPPYGITFMGKSWDHGVPSAEVWRLLSAALKPGAFGMAFGGTRTWHRLAVAIEDAGFELRDTILYLYGAGFPKSLAIGKAIDREAGAVREDCGLHPNWRDKKRDNGQSMNPMPNESRITLPATPEAEAWEGHGSALKPAWEPCLLFRKPTPLTYAQNALQHGCGGLWIDGARVGVDDGTRDRPPSKPSARTFAQDKWTQDPENRNPFCAQGLGRWPANLAHDNSPEAVAGFPVTTGQQNDAKGAEPGKKTVNCYGEYSKTTPFFKRGDTGSASRYFYSAKVSPSERAGCGHPCMKPVDLCRWLATLLLPPERDTPRRLLVPFSGAGSEMVGALEAGWDEVVGIELDPAWAEVARQRCRDVAPLFAEEVTG